MSTQDHTAMMEVVPTADGRFAVRVFGAGRLETMQGDIATQAEADEWMLQQALRRDELESSPHLLTPGGNQTLG